MKDTEERIWDTITDSAKTKLDYAEFQEAFPVGADMALYMIVMEFASGETEEIVGLKMMNHLMMSGYLLKKDEMQELLAGKKKLLSKEISTAQLALSMLQEGTNPTAVLSFVSQMLP